MLSYIGEIKHQLRDVYHFKPDRIVGQDLCFDHIPDGEYPMKIDGRMDYVEIVDGKIHCCNFKKKKKKYVRRTPDSRDPRS